MSYILAVNPAMFSELEGMPAGAVFTSTALAAIVGTMTMAFLDKLPFGLAPGMGLNAFFGVYRMFGHGLLLAVCTHSRTHRGYSIYYIKIQFFILSTAKNDKVKQS